MVDPVVQFPSHPLFFCASTFGGQVIFRGSVGLFCAMDDCCLCKLPEEVTERKTGLLFDVIFAIPTTLSLASVANDLLLLLVTSPEDETEYWWPEGRGAFVDGGTMRGKPMVNSGDDGGASEVIDAGDGTKLRISWFAILTNITRSSCEQSGKIVRGQLQHSGNSMTDKWKGFCWSSSFGGGTKRVLKCAIRTRYSSVR